MGEKNEIHQFTSGTGKVSKDFHFVSTRPIHFLLNLSSIISSCWWTFKFNISFFPHGPEHYRVNFSVPRLSALNLKFENPGCRPVNCIVWSEMKRFSMSVVYNGTGRGREWNFTFVCFFYMCVFPFICVTRLKFIVIISGKWSNLETSW